MLTVNSLILYFKILRFFVVFHVSGFLLFFMFQAVELVDYRTNKTCACWLIPDVTALRFHPNGMDVAYGTSAGLLAMLDLRKVI
jgi:hypothetical protein